MSGPSRPDIYTVVNRYFGVNSGYLGDFSYLMHFEFYPEFRDLDIDPEHCSALAGGAQSGRTFASRDRPATGGGLECARPESCAPLSDWRAQFDERQPDAPWPAC